MFRRRVIFSCLEQSTGMISSPEKRPVGHKFGITNNKYLVDDPKQTKFMFFSFSIWPCFCVWKVSCLIVERLNLNFSNRNLWFFLFTFTFSLTPLWGKGRKKGKVAGRLLHKEWERERNTFFVYENCFLLYKYRESTKNFLYLSFPSRIILCSHRYYFYTSHFHFHVLFPFSSSTV